MSKLVKNIVERAVRAAGIGYFVVWQTNGLGYDTMFTAENGKAAVVAAVCSVGLSFGFLKAGDPNSGGIA